MKRGYSRQKEGTMRGKETSSRFLLLLSLIKFNVVCKESVSRHLSRFTKSTCMLWIHRGNLQPYLECLCICQHHFHNWTSQQHPHQLFHKPVLHEPVYSKNVPPWGTFMVTSSQNEHKHSMQYNHKKRFNQTGCKTPLPNSKLTLGTITMVTQILEIRKNFNFQTIQQEPNRLCILRANAPKMA